MFEDNVSGRLTAHSKKNFDKVNGQEDLMSGGKYEFAYKTEMNIKEAEMFMFMKLRDRLDRVVTKERNAGKTKFGGVGYVEPGGENYKEIIFTLKGDKGYPVEQELLAGAIDGTNKKKIKSSFPYRSPAVHFGTENEFAHVRFKTREIPGPKAGVKEGSLKVLSVEEMQSDIVQDMKKNFGEKVTDFPFKNNWYELVTKRLIRYAADNNFDAVSIPKGKTIADRYRQTLFDAKAVDIQITAGTTKGKFNFDLEFFNRGKKASKEIMSFDETDYSKIKEIIGVKEYQKLQQKFEDIIDGKILQTDDSKIINERVIFDKPKQLGTGIGKAQLYDQAIPSFLKKYGKKWNAKVYDGKVPTLSEKDYAQAIAANQKVSLPDGMPVTIIELTDEMKQSVQQDGQALFNIFGIGSAAAIGSDAVLQNDRNNTISNLTEN